MQQKYQDQQIKRLSWMPWLFHGLKPSLKSWVIDWQKDLQAQISDLETVTFSEGCFVSPEAMLFAEPHRGIVIGAGCTIAAQTVLHGPVSLADHVSINHHCALDGGQKGLSIGRHTRVAHACTLYAFNHQMAADQLIRVQAVQSSGIQVGEDVWVGARTCITDGVAVADHAVIGMGSVVTKDVDAWQKVAGVPAKPIGVRL